MKHSSPERGQTWVVVVGDAHGLLGMTIPELPEAARRQEQAPTREGLAPRRSISRRAAQRVATGGYFGRRTTSPRYGLGGS